MTAQLSIAQYRALIEHSVDMIVLVDRGGRRHYVSPACRTLLGYEPDEMLKINARNAMHPDDAEAVLMTLAAGAMGQTQRFRMKHKDGRYVWVEATGRILGDSKLPDCNLITVRNLEPRIAIERDLAAARDQFRSLYESTPAMLHSIDTDGRILMVSDAWLRKLGYAREETIGRRSTEFLTPDSQKYAKDVVLPGFFETGRCDDVEYEMVCKGGGVIQVLLSAVLEYDQFSNQRISLAAIIDITSKRRAQRQLVESEMRYRTLADHSSDVVFQLDDKLNCTYVSPACVEVMGREPEQLLGKRPQDMVHPEDSPQVVLGYESMLNGGVNQRSTINRVRHSDGRWMWIEARLRALRESEGGPCRGIIGALRDVTERREAEDELEKAKLEAESASRFKAEFVANMSHELRTPLTGILGVLEILNRDTKLGEDQRQYLNMAHDAGQTLMDIVNDVLDFSKIESGHLAIETLPFQLAPTLASCAAVVAEASKAKSISLSLDLNDEAPILWGDAARIKQVVLNLLTNAVKFSDGGEIVVKARYCDFRLRISVEDSGIGIAPEHLASVFERFKQADGSISRKYGGAGLGLPISQRLVQLMGGNITADSVVGQGSTFTVEIPMREAVTGKATSEATPDIAAPRWRILLAEDNKINQKVIGEMLLHCGHIVTAVDDGAAALAEIKASAFDIVLMDVQMPEMDGLAATRAIRHFERTKARSATPIVGLTASAMTDDKTACLKAGMDVHVAKPIRWSNLFNVCDKLVAAKNRAEEAVLDTKSLELMAGIMGRAKVSELLEDFIERIDNLFPEAENIGPAELRAYAHSCLSMSGQLGFIELSRLCAEIETEAKHGGVSRVGELVAAKHRAAQAARALEFVKAS